MRKFTVSDLATIMIVLTVVIAVIIPSQNAFRKGPPKVSCASNLKNIGLVMHVYADRNSGRFPVIDAPYTAGRVFGMADVWHGIGRPEVFFCPVSKGVRPKNRREILAGGSSYTYAFGLTVQDAPDTALLADGDSGAPGTALKPYRADCNHGTGGHVFSVDGRAQWVPDEKSVLNLQKGGRDATAWNGSTGNALVN